MDNKRNLSDFCYNYRNIIKSSIRSAIL